MNNSSWQTRQVWIGGSALAALVVVAAAWFLAIHPERSDTSDTRSETASVELQNDVLAANNASLAAEKAHLSASQRKLARSLDALPPGSDLPDFTKVLTALAKAAHVSVTSISIGATTPVAPAVDATTSPAPTATTSPAEAPQSTSMTSAAPAPSSAAAAQYSIPITVAANGTAATLTSFVHAVEFSPRAATVTSAQLAGTGAKTTLSLQFNVFTAPLTSAQVKDYQHLLTAGS